VKTNTRQIFSPRVGEGGGGGRRAENDDSENQTILHVCVAY
jgi:hypothetical protein